jgi:uncharacterized delta-60 repeat protein
MNCEFLKKPRAAMGNTQAAGRRKVAVICGMVLSACAIFLASSSPAMAQAGQLDPTFGNGGKVTTSFGSVDVSNLASAAALQSDGKIVVAGTSGAAFALTLVRYNTDGTLDTAFGTGGIATDRISDVSQAFGVAVPADGKIVVVGFVNTGASGGAVVRFNANGTLDTGFGQSGVVQTVTPVRRSAAGRW